MPNVTAQTHRPPWTPSASPSPQPRAGTAAGDRDRWPAATPRWRRWWSCSWCRTWCCRRRCEPITPFIAGTLHLSPQAISLASGLANAGYAVGTVLAVQFAQHLPQRRMMLVYATLLVTGSVLAAAATGPAMFIVGHVLQGLCTSLLLIAAAPPLFLGYPAAKLRWTAMIMNMCIFGAVAAGPLIGGAQASFHAWRPLFWIVAGVAVVGAAAVAADLRRCPARRPQRPVGRLAVGLAATGSVAAFLGAAELTHPPVPRSRRRGPAAGRAGADRHPVDLRVPRPAHAAHTAPAGQHDPADRDRASPSARRPPRSRPSR